MTESPQFTPNVLRQSGAVPYRLNDQQLEVLLVTSRSRRHWIVPKGVIEYNLSPATSAAKEAEEEAGVRGTIIPKPLGVYTRRKAEGTLEVILFPLAVTEVLSVWPEEHLRRRRWTTISEARIMIDQPELAHLVCLLPHRLKQDRAFTPD